MDTARKFKIQESKFLRLMVDSYLIQRENNTHLCKHNDTCNNNHSCNLNSVMYSSSILSKN